MEGVGVRRRAVWRRLTRQTLAEKIPQAPHVPRSPLLVHDHFPRSLILLKRSFLPVALNENPSPNLDEATRQRREMRRSHECSFTSVRDGRSRLLSAIFTHIILVSHARFLLFSLFSVRLFPGSFLFEYLIIIPLYPISLFHFIIIFLILVLADQGPSPFTATINASSIPACLFHLPRGPCCFAVSV